MTGISFTDLAHDAPQFDAVYDLFGRDIPAPFLEHREFLRNRLRVRDAGPATEQEKILLQPGYTLHLIAAEHSGKVVGAVYGHLISNIGPDKRSIAFVTYLSVSNSLRRRGIGSALVRQVRAFVEEDSRRLTGKALSGMVFEIETEGKPEIKGLVGKMYAAPLDIVYVQPALRADTQPERMQLWFLPLDPPVRSAEQLRLISYPAQFVRSLVLNLLTMEYVGPDLTGFRPEDIPFSEFLASLGTRSRISFLA